jgi:hypothetical protein
MSSLIPHPPEYQPLEGARCLVFIAAREHNGVAIGYLAPGAMIPATMKKIRPAKDADRAQISVIAEADEMDCRAMTLLPIFMPVRF